MKPANYKFKAPVRCIMLELIERTGCLASNPTSWDVRGTTYSLLFLHFFLKVKKIRFENNKKQKTKAKEAATQGF